jgi:hypothetical protein
MSSLGEPIHQEPHPHPAIERYLIGTHPIIRMMIEHQGVCQGLDSVPIRPQSQIASHSLPIGLSGPRLVRIHVRTGTTICDCQWTRGGNTSAHCPIQRLKLPRGRHKIVTCNATRWGDHTIPDEPPDCAAAPWVQRPYRIPPMGLPCRNGYDLSLPRYLCGSPLWPSAWLARP